MADFAENGVVLKGPLIRSAALRSLARSLCYAPLRSATLRSLTRSLTRPSLIRSAPLNFAPLHSAHSLARFALLRSLVGASDAMVQRSLKKNEECAGKMKNATENEEFDTMVRI